MARNSNNNNRNNNGSNNQKKHSGAKTGGIRTGAHAGEQYTTGWNYSKRHGLISFGCFPYEGSKTVQSARGQQWTNVMVKVNKGIAGTSITSGMMDSTGRVIVKDHGIVINPKAPNGGYCGTFNK